jgi:hypothetical protein
MPSRLEDHKQKMFYQRVGLIGAGILLLIIFMLVVGFQLVIRGSVFFGSLGSKKITPTDQSSSEFYGTLTVDTIPTATNSAQFVIAGSANNFSTLQFYINKKQVKQTTVKNDAYSLEIGDLKTGTNEVYVKALTKDKQHEQASDKYNVVYKNTKPKLEISEPSDNSTTHSSDIKVAGKTDQDVTIRINGGPTVVDTQGSFQQTVHLNEGDNKIKIVAEDDAGNTEQKELTIKYQKDE